jgi:esterase/lipase
MLGALVAAPVVWLGWPAPAPAPAHPVPASNYEEALERIARLTARDSLALHEQCGTTALLHGARTPRAVVLIHGITNCPLQFVALGRILHDEGDNVLIPRVPHHGLADRMTEDLARLEAGEVTALVAECVGLARGLGDTVIVAGLSTSGVAAAWAGQECEGVDRVVAIAPAFRPPWGPPWMRFVLARTLQRMPNLFVWWDREKKTELDGPTQCYPRFPTHALAESYRLGEEVLGSARRKAPHARDLTVVTTAIDGAVDNDCAASLAAAWRRSGSQVREYRFADSLHVPHDMIDPLQVGARVDLVYPELARFIRGEQSK